ncbi:hypothetical protein, partial [Helicobacter pylori]|uniref:hypothetical protein n=1 Tax=Helicobacter pylori TaxID=210 RepID=UPI0036F3ED5D
GFLDSCVFVCFIFLKSYFYLILVFLACCASYSFCLSFGFRVLNTQGFGFSFLSDLVEPVVGVQNCVPENQCNNSKIIESFS